MDDPYEMSDSDYDKKAYEEYVMDEVTRNNLTEIDRNISEKKINAENKKDIIEYLENLMQNLQAIKKSEYNYEGEHNDNVNEYILEVKKLLDKVIIQA